MNPVDPEAYEWKHLYFGPEGDKCLQCRRDRSEHPDQQEVLRSATGGEEPKQEDLLSYPDLTPEGSAYYNPRTSITWVYRSHRWVKHDE